MTNTKETHVKDLEIRSLRIEVTVHDAYGRTEALVQDDVALTGDIIELGCGATHSDGGAVSAKIRIIPLPYAFEVRNPKAARELTEQWIAVYQNEQEHGADHRRILSTLQDILNAYARGAYAGE